MKQVLKVRCIVEGRVQHGEVLFSPDPIAFLQGVDPERGVVSDSTSQIYDQPFAGRVLVFPNAVGSSVGAYVIYRLKKNRKAPKAMVNQSTDITTASGCAMAGIPLFDLFQGNLANLKDAKRITLDARKSELRIEE